MHKIVHTIYAFTAITVAAVVFGAIILAMLLCTGYDCYQIYLAAKP